MTFFIAKTKHSKVIAKREGILL